MTSLPTYHLPVIYADDCIMYKKTDTPDDAKILQEDLRKLEIWEETWGMKFNIEKCMIFTITLKHNPYIAECTLHGIKRNPVANANTWVSILIENLHSTTMWTLFAKNLITL